MKYRFIKTKEITIPNKRIHFVEGIAIDENGEVVANRYSSDEIFLEQDLANDIPIKDGDTYEKNW